MSAKSFDPKCLELAEHFLEKPGEAVSAEKAEDLAQFIQNAMEWWRNGEVGFVDEEEL